MSAPTTAWPVGTRRWLEAAAILIRAAMLDSDRYARDSCVNAAAIGVAVLRYFGVTATPVAVQCLAATADAWAWHTEHGWDALAPGGHVVGIGFRGRQGPDPNTWDGHLVLHLPGRAPTGEGAHLLDLAIDQASRPELGMPIDGPLVGQLGPDRLDAGGWVGFTEDGCSTVLAYRRLTGRQATEWRHFSGWTRRGAVHRATVADAIRSIRKVST